MKQSDQNESQLGDLQCAGRQYRIDFNHIIENLVLRKKIYCIIITASFLLALVLSFTLRKEYSVRSLVFPPSEKNVCLLTVPSYSGSTKDELLFYTTVDDLFKSFVRNLYSVEMRMSFFKTNNMAEEFRSHSKEDDSEEYIFYKEFDDKIKINTKEDNATKAIFLEIKLSGDNPQKTSLWLNEYVSFIDRITVNTYQEAIIARINVEKNAVRSKIISLKETGEQERQFAIMDLEENLHIAEQLNLIEPLNIPFHSFRQSISDEESLFISEANTPEYFKGVKLLKSELNSIKNRKNNDPFIPGLDHQLRKEKYLATLLNNTFEKASSVTVNQKATPEDMEISPNAILVVVAGIIVGILICLLFVCFDTLFAKRNTNCRGN